MPDQKPSAAPSEVKASDDVDNSTIIDYDGKLIVVGAMVVVPGSEEYGAGRVDSINSIGDNEGRPPTVFVRWPDEPGLEHFDCNVRDYRQEGPSGPYVYVCAELRVTDQAEQEQALDEAKRDDEAAEKATAISDGVAPASRPAGDDA
jgi:hypothetical protein